MKNGVGAGRAIVGGLTGLALAGCRAVSPPGPPSPVLAANAMGETAAQQHAVIAAIESTLGNEMTSPADVALAGFNVIDQKCDAYVGGLYQVDKSSKVAGSVLTTTQTATQAVLHDFGIGGVTIDILAQIFGVASAFNDTAAKAYLLTIGPSNVAATLSKMQDTYRNQFGLQMVEVRTEPQVVKHLQAYLRLCSPVYIEAYVANLISGADAATKGSGDGERGIKAFGAAPRPFDPPISLTLVSGR